MRTNQGQPAIFLFPGLVPFSSRVVFITDMLSILRIYDEVFECLREQHLADPDFVFTARSRNGDGRLQQGFWFPGDEKRVTVSFWEAPIALVTQRDGHTSLEMTEKQPGVDKQFIRRLAQHLNMAFHASTKTWFKSYLGKNYLYSLRHFLAKDKKRIDCWVLAVKPAGISMIAPEKFQSDIDDVNLIRTLLSDPRREHQVARISWNTNGWQKPSGIEGKLIDNENELAADHDFSLDEWLLDTSRPIDDYHYAFLKPVNLCNEPLSGFRFHVHLFAHNGFDGENYFVGTLRNVECISPFASERMYQIYQQNGWIDEMKKQIAGVHGDCARLSKLSPKSFFNVRFKFSDAQIHKHPVCISLDDINITTLDYQLLPLRREISFS